MGRPTQLTGTNQSIGLISFPLECCFGSRFSTTRSTNPSSLCLGTSNSWPAGRSSASRCPYQAGNTRSLSEHGSQAAWADDSALRESRLVPGHSSNSSADEHVDGAVFVSSHLAKHLSLS